MDKEQTIPISKISVRKLVEFILRSGDLDSSKGGQGADTDAMQQGSRIHRKIQKSKGAEYSAEVPLVCVKEMNVEGRLVMIQVEGRADGIVHNAIPQDGEPEYTIDEIKAVYRDIESLEEPEPLHLAQVMCYAAIFAEQNDLPCMGVRVTYCQMETQLIREFNEVKEAEELRDWMQKLLLQYAKWADQEQQWARVRDASIQKLEFPFAYRKGQKELAKGVYLTIARKKRLYIEAPTGAGKTMSAVFPTVKAMGEGLISKIFYLTAKTITRTVAEEAFSILAEKGAKLKLVTLTAKDKICILDRPDCNPASCPRARGHYDRVNDAIFDLLTSEEVINRELILEYAARHEVCPFEMALDVTLWSDGIICDYNYVFDPNVYLRRFFSGDAKRDYAFLVDEAHNLVDRAREMYSATLVKQHFLDVKKMIQLIDRPLAKELDACNTVLLKYKRECEECEVLEDVGNLVLPVMRTLTRTEDFMKDILPHHPDFAYLDEVLELYFACRHFVAMYEGMGEDYMIYDDYSEEGEFQVRLQCMNPGRKLDECLKRGRSAVFFSATLLPIQYYKEQLAGTEEDYAMYAESTFPPDNKLLLIARDVSTKYTRRTTREYERIAGYIVEFVMAKPGNYMVFFPSYRMLAEVCDYCRDICEQQQLEDISWREQFPGMQEMEREEFLAEFADMHTDSYHVGMCIMGGIFGEGIDLKEDRLIGAVMVGTGLPMVGNEREIFREYYEEMKGQGFQFAYLYPGMNKVLQAAGRVIRTATDRGAILLLDERFLSKSYQELFPREWNRYLCVDKEGMKNALHTFWES